MPTIKDVARLAGVGVGTVSRVINNSGAVRNSTREKVEAAIKELNFVPSEIARTFKAGTSKIVALLLPSVFHSFFSEIAYYVEMELDKRGYKLMLCNSNGSKDKEIYYFDLLTQNKVAGIIALTYNDIDEYVDDSYPIVSIDRHFANDVNCITSDNFGGGKMALEQLHRKGYDLYAYIGTYNTRIDSEVKYRKEGFKEYALEQGLEFVLHVEQDPIQNYDDFLDRFFDTYQANSYGIFVENDILATITVNKATSRGLMIAKDVGVIGFDGISQLEFFQPKIATIRQQVELIARESVQNVIDQIDKKPTRERTVIPVTFLDGESF